MATRSKGNAQAGAQSRERNEIPRSLQIADGGINTSLDFRNFMSAIMSDVISGRLTPNMTNAACNAGGKLLKMVELEQKYATNPERPRRVLTVAFEATEVQPGSAMQALADGD